MGQGGSRFGAGRPGHKLKSEQSHRIDVRDWSRRGLLKAYSGFSWSWNRGGEPTGSIGVSLSSLNALTLRYTFINNNGPHNVLTEVHLLRTSCAFGGSRPWFGCPCCFRRVAVLYLRSGRFACRKCQRIAYSSQSDDPLDRMWRKQTKLESQLGENSRRPKGMRLRTFDSLKQKIWALEGRRDDAFSVYAARLLKLETCC